MFHVEIGLISFLKTLNTIVYNY